MLSHLDEEIYKLKAQLKPESDVYQILQKNPELFHIIKRLADLQAELDSLRSEVHRLRRMTNEI